MRPTILIAMALGVAMLMPCAAYAFQSDSAAATNPDGTARFSDPDDAPAALGGLQIFGGAGTDSGQSDGIPQSLPASDAPSWYYSTPSFRATR
jgi:hypothetical protein